MNTKLEWRSNDDDHWTYGDASSLVAKLDRNPDRTWTFAWLTFNAVLPNQHYVLAQRDAQSKLSLWLEQMSQSVRPTGGM